MRHKEVWIPLSVPKEALLQDLDYYGFDVDPSKIHGGSSDSLTQMQRRAREGLIDLQEERPSFRNGHQVRRPCL
jgi:hypothetical protein